MKDKTPLGDNGDELNSGANWKKSSYSESNGHCVQTARLASRRIGVRDSKAVNGPTLRFEPEAWAIFIAAVRST
jgi:Domain of unknown function (DUF397)